ncbi:hypothetical protein DPMN_189646 [Dreissena polymorpha]|uniref:Myb/SANT-like DNA-binding domain-containing protein n=1 Tax=Dreissena polymorpha TaxID=45954 RepID=A0A9D4DUP4_DREPO|nr:hypothetical protein DPMN_189646 [Dreissena polymorpha]
MNIRQLKYTRKNERRRQQRFESVPFVVQKEIYILLELVIENKNLLEGKHGPLVTVANKRKKWQEIVAAINACGLALKTADTCKKKGTGH